MSYLRYANMKTLLFVLFFIGILCYTYFQMRSVLTGPVVTITEPKNGETVEDPLVEVTGTTKNIASIMLNGRPIFVDEAGLFKEKLLLSPGYNIITLSARDKFERPVLHTLELIYN